jgi:hypothetical protein
MLALLEQHNVTLATRLDLLRGAWDAWTEQRRYVMTPLFTSAWRGTRLGLIPCVLPVAGFLLSLDLRADSTLLNLLRTGPAPIATILLVCLWAGKREAERDSAWPGRLLASAATAIVGLLGSMVLQDVLLLSDLGFGISGHVIALQGGSVSYGGTVASTAASLVSARSLLIDAIAFVAAGTLGACVGALGTTLKGVRLTRDVRSA